VKCHIAVDMDGVLAESEGPLIEKINQHLGLTIHPQQITHYYRLDELLAEELGSPELAHEYIGRIFWSDGFLVNLPPYLATIRGMRELAGMASSVSIVTARNIDRNPTAVQQTKLWLDRYGIVYDQLVFTNDKAMYCRSKAVRYIVEDAPHQVSACAAMGVGVFMIDKSYNRQIEATGANGIWRVTHLTDVPPLFKADLLR
jgi:uncharacterized HAD superfamily protein